MERKQPQQLKINPRFIHKQSKPLPLTALDNLTHPPPLSSAPLLWNTDSQTTRIRTTILPGRLHALISPRTIRAVLPTTRRRRGCSRRGGRCRRRDTRTSARHAGRARHSWCARTPARARCVITHGTDGRGRSRDASPAARQVGRANHGGRAGRAGAAGAVVSDDARRLGDGSRSCDAGAAARSAGCANHSRRASAAAGARCVVADSADGCGCCGGGDAGAAAWETTRASHCWCTGRTGAAGAVVSDDAWRLGDGSRRRDALS